MVKEKIFLSTAITLRYVSALSLLAALSLISYFILKENIKANKGNAAVVNISGRQRMLSQRIAFLSLELAAGAAQEKETIRKELSDAIGLMEISHDALILGDPPFQAAPKLSAGARSIYFSAPYNLDTQVRRYLAMAKIWASDNEVRLQDPRLEDLLKTARGELLPALDAVVRQYQEESESNILWLERLQAGVLGSAEVILVITGLFLFRPMVRRIRQKTEEIQKQDAALIRTNEQMEQEINERRELERRLRITHEFDETLLKTIPLGIDIVDEEGTILYLNEKMQTVFGREAIGMKCYFLYKDDKKQCFNCPLRDGVRIGEVKNIEVKDVLGAKTFLLTHTGMFYEGKKAILEIFEDISEYKRAQDKLALSERLASIGRMASVIAHEFRNQLGVISNAAYFLKMKLQDKDEKIKRTLATLDAQVAETQKIIENILAFSRTKQPEFQTVDLESILRSSIADVIIPPGIEVTTRIEKLPSLEADPVLLSTVFVNIILNAVQAMNEKGRLLIEVTKVNNYVIIIFRDTGKGIKEEDKARLFEPFFSTKARGAGLGLATAKIMIQGHHGSIEVESEYGQGTSVIIKLPIGPGLT